MTATPPPLPRAAQIANLWRELAAEIDSEAGDIQATVRRGVINVCASGGRVTSLGHDNWARRADGSEARIVTVRAIALDGRAFLIELRQIRLTRYVTRPEALRPGESWAREIRQVTAGGCVTISRKWMTP